MKKIDGRQGIVNRRIYKKYHMAFASAVMAAALIFVPVKAQAAGELTVGPAGINLDPARGDFLCVQYDQEAILQAGLEALAQRAQEEAENEYAKLAIARVDKYVNVRSLPSTDGQILGKIYNGAVAHIIETAGENDEWFHVTSGNVEGYIKTEYFIYGKDAAEVIEDYVTRYAIIKAQRLNVRKDTSTESRRIGYLDQGERAKITENLGDWLKVEYSEGQTGYVSSEYVDVTEEFTYAISIEEERAELERQRELEKRRKQEEAEAAQKLATEKAAQAAQEAGRGADGNAGNPEIFEYPKTERLVTEDGRHFYDS